MVMEVALPDGTKRKGWDKLKEAAKLNVEASTSKGESRKEIQAEIKKLGIRMNKPVL
jgi:hypothetical protein